MVTQLRQVNAPYLLLITSLVPIPIMMVNSLFCVRLNGSTENKNKNADTENNCNVQNYSFFVSFALKLTMHGGLVTQKWIGTLHKKVKELTMVPQQWEHLGSGQQMTYPMMDIKNWIRMFFDRLSHFEIFGSLSVSQIHQIRQTFWNKFDYYYYYFDFKWLVAFDITFLLFPHFLEHLHSYSFTRSIAVIKE